MSSTRTRLSPGAPPKPVLLGWAFLQQIPTAHTRDFFVPAGFHLCVRPRTLFTEHEAPQLVAQLLHIIGVDRLAKALRQIEEGLLLFPARLDSLLDELHQDTVIAEAALLRHWSPLVPRLRRILPSGDPVESHQRGAAAL